jgi:endonuclease/exonuclease/phosphatase family metal-dependent hydrolase
MPAGKRRITPLLMLLSLVHGCSGPGSEPVAQRDAGCRSFVVAAAAPGLLMPAEGHSMAWTLPADSAARVGLDAYCAGVGPALLRVAATPAVAADELVVVTWNIALGAGAVSRFIEDLRAGVFTAGVPVRSFALLLQEVPRIGSPVPPADALPAGVLVSSPDPVPGPSVELLARAAGLHLLYVPSMREGRGVTAVDHGTALLSTLPLHDVRVIELPLGIRRRVAVAARVDIGVDARPVHLVSAHLDNFSMRRAVGSLGGIRSRQARALRRALPPAPVVLGADLNTWARGTREPAYHMLRAVLPGPAELPPGATARRLGIPRRLDYLLASSPSSWHFATRRIPDRYGSDHHPVLGMLRVH